MDGAASHLAERKGAWKDCRRPESLKDQRRSNKEVVVVVFSCLVMSDSFDPMDCSTPCLPVPHQLPKVCPSLCPLRQWCHPAISSSDALFCICPQFFPASGTFLMGQLFTSDDQNTEVSASASVLPMSIQCWLPLRLTGLISLLSKGLSGVFSSTTAPKHRFFGTLPSLRSRSHNCTWPLGRTQPWLYRPLLAK